MDNPQANVGKRWTSEDEARLASLWLNRGYTVSQIAYALKRDTGGIMCRLARNDLLCGLTSVEISTWDTAKSVARKKDVYTACTKSLVEVNTQVDTTNALQAVNEQQEEIMKEKINWALNLGFGGFFTKTDLGWYKTYDELPEGHWVMGAYPAFKNNGRPTAQKVLMQTKECPPELKTQRLDFLMPLDQTTTVAQLRERDEAAAYTVEMSIRQAESRAEDESIRESLGADVMHFIETMLKPKLGEENLHEVAEAIGTMVGEKELAEHLGNIADLVDEVKKLVKETDQ